MLEISNATQKAKEESQPEFNKKYGRLLHRDFFGGWTVCIYEKGYVSLGLFAAMGSPQKLISISSSADVSKKTAIGRGVVGMMTLGANLVLTPNKRGDAYLTITTDVKTHMLHTSPPTEMQLKAMKKLEAAGNAALQISNKAGIEQSVTSNSDHLADELAKVADLHTRGLLNDEEFLKAKEKILGE